jgi:DnaJ-class molecular chaperone
MTGPSPDYYAVLQIPRSASQQEIARAYRALMRSHHPDVASGDTAPGELQLIMQAFAVLRNPKRRAAYDREISRAAAAGETAGKSQNIPRPRGPAPGTPAARHTRAVGERTVALKPT